jgi:hypothetical protein
MATYPIIKPQDVLDDCVYTVLRAFYRDYRLDYRLLFWLQICRCPITVAFHSVKGSFILSDPAQFITVQPYYPSSRF